ncbi:MAG: peptidyl-prolyl cis-trans isomerase [Vicinamibacterales bacterium]
MTMLDRMRRHRGWLKWSLALVVLAFIVFYIPSFLADPVAVGTANPSEVVASIENREVTAGTFQQRYLSQVQAYQTAYGGGITDTLLRQLGIDQQILQQLIDEEVAVLEAERQGITVSDDELAKAIFAIPGLQENGQFIGEARYEQLLRAQAPPMTKAGFEAGLRRNLMIEKLRAALTGWMAASDMEVEREYRLRNEKVRLQVVTLTPDAFRDQVTVSDTDVAGYFETRKAEYRVGEQRKIRYLLLDRDQARASQVVAPAEVEQYYNQNIQLYQTPEQVRASHILLQTGQGQDDAAVRARAEELLARVRAGEDFAELARQFSEDEGSKANGGDLDYFSRGRMVPEFESAAFALEPGATSDVVQSQFGFHIIRSVDRRPAVTQTLDDVRAQIEDQLAWQRVDQQLADRARDIAARVTSPAALQTVATELGLTVQESDFFPIEGPVPGLGVAPQVSGTAFRLEEGAVSEALPSPRGQLFMTVSETRDPYVPELDEVRDRVREDLIRSRALELSRERANAVASTLRSARDFEAAARAAGLEARDTGLVTRESPLPDIGVSPEVDAAAFSLATGAVSEPIATPDGTLIVKVMERDEVTPDEFSAARDRFREELLNERRSQFFTAYMAKVKQGLQIQINTDVVQRATGII